MMSGKPQSIILDEPNRCVVGAAYMRGTFGYRVQHRLNIRRRTSDDTKNLTRRGLLLQCFLQLLEQPHILDGNDGLVSEGLDQLNLPLSKWLLKITPDNDAADWRSFSQQGYNQQGP